MQTWLMEQVFCRFKIFCYRINLLNKQFTVWAIGLWNRDNFTNVVLYLQTVLSSRQVLVKKTRCMLSPPKFAGTTVLKNILSTTSITPKVIFHVHVGDPVSRIGLAGANPVSGFYAIKSAIVLECQSIASFYTIAISYQFASACFSSWLDKKHCGSKVSRPRPQHTAPSQPLNPDIWIWVPTAKH